jgi:hypothetical protein
MTTLYLRDGHRVEVEESHAKVLSKLAEYASPATFVVRPMASAYCHEVVTILRPDQVIAVAGVAKK